jgi:hypothetical protein
MAAVVINDLGVSNADVIREKLYVKVVGVT